MSRTSRKLRPGHTSRGRLDRVLRRGEFAFTVEFNPPDSADPNEVFERGAIFDGWVDGINATYGSGANCHMSSVGICTLLTRRGYAPIMQISCRDRNRIAIQGDVLGAAAMGVSNILCLTGDGVESGDQRQESKKFLYRDHAADQGNAVYFRRPCDGLPPGGTGLRGRP